jgi:hypothetical protein
MRTRPLTALLLVAACGFSHGFVPPSMALMKSRLGPATSGQFASRPALALSKTIVTRPLLRQTKTGVELHMHVLNDILERKKKDIEELKGSLSDGARKILQHTACCGILYLPCSGLAEWAAITSICGKDVRLWVLCATSLAG